MGSSGSGSFSDYSGAKRQHDEKEGISGGDSGVDQCKIAFSVALEDVAMHNYFLIKNNVPPPGTKIEIKFNNRLIVHETSSGYAIGALPTKYNYLLACLKDGFNYAGLVSTSYNSPLPQVVVDLGPV
ncbi:hypothetical protein [Pantoea sp. Cy-640]|uniref:hypothetical protein n=1 Tax=Pantoea sp. Cy-640 TaxID=2608353 RepID=UPI00141A0B50|nr:hypothetical protein [Pantoea sp. Cy-640]NIG14199.1 hypothetical protein [Pantoea sp. Cy-640]